MSFFEDLQSRTADARENLLGIENIQDALRGRINRAQYVSFLAQAYHHVKHTAPLLMACGSRLPEILGWLRTAVARYADEEIGHEEWILSDIAACGADPERVRNAMPAIETELMVAYAYHQVDRRNPVGFFGMVHVLEGTSISTADSAADMIQKALGLPNKAFSYLRSHGALDQEHVQFFTGLMNRIEDPAEQQQIIHSAKMFYLLYGNVLRSVEPSQALALVA